jgi:thymidine kinase
MSLDIFIGPMYAGKTSLLVEKYKGNNDINKIIIDYDIHGMSDHDVIIGSMSTHDDIMVDHVYKTKELRNLYDIDRYNCFSKDVKDDKFKGFINTSHIYINECQFFHDLKQFVLGCIKLGVHVNLFGLDGDFKQEKFGQVLDLIPFCNSLTKLKGKCQYCENDSIISHRITNDKEQYLTNAPCYVPLCMSCSEYV